ncbi:MAG: hypothetical protein PHX62_02880 [Bacilli bacterium]|nr:hypothetical protein [Bacilli bacterium]
MEKHEKILIERFSQNSLIALATVDNKGNSWVRAIDARVTRYAKRISILFTNIKNTYL